MADSKVVFETELDTTGLKQGLEKLDSSGLTDLTLGASSDQLTKLGTKFGNIIGTATALAIAKSIGSTGIAFDTAMSQVAATMGTTVGDIQHLSELAQIAGRTTKFTAVEAAEAINYMALAGWDVEQIMSGFPHMLELAAAGNLDLAYASDVVTDGLTAMGMTAEETGVLVDQMAKADVEANTSVKQLGQGMLAIGATARILEGGTAELATTLGLLADNGIKGAQGGRQLRNVINSLASPTKKGAEALEELGVSAFDADGSFRPLSDTFDDLRASMAGLSDKESIGYLDKIFNKEDYKSVNALLGTTAERWTSLYDAVYNSEGSAAKMAQTQIDNLGGDLTLFKSAWEGLKLALYEPVEPLARGYVQGATGAVNTATDILAKGLVAGAEVAQDQVKLSWSDLWGMLTAPDSTSGAAGKPFGEGKSIWDWLLPSAGAETMSGQAEAAAQGVQQQLSAELRKAFADGDPAVQAALMKGITPEDTGKQSMKTVADTMVNDLATALANSGEKISSALSSLIDPAMQSVSEAGAALSESVWEPKITAQDMASSIIDGVRENLRRLDGMTATVTIDAAQNGSIPEVDGTHKTGLDYVPFDNYIARLHAGEMVLPAEEADALRRLSGTDFASRLASRTFRQGYDAVEAIATARSFNQTNHFNVPVQTPDVFAQTMREFAEYGLAGQ